MGNSLFRSLGEFAGHIWRGVKTPVHAPPPATPPPPQPPQQHTVEVRRTVQERTAETPVGPVTLRRTTIDEVIPPPGSGAP